MGCISSKPSIDQQVTIPSKTNHTTDDHVLKFIPPKHDNNNDDDTLTVHTNINNLKVADSVSERCSRIHTVEEYDELLKRISGHKQAELETVPDTTENGDINIETQDKKKLEFQTVASLRQWLNAPGGDIDAVVAASAEYANLKAGFSFYGSDNSLGAEEKSGRQEEGESIVELVAAFDKYMQQLQIDEENFLKQIHIIN